MNLEEWRITIFVVLFGVTYLASVNGTVKLTKVVLLQCDVQFRYLLKKTAQQYVAVLFVLRIQGQINETFGGDVRFWLKNHGTIAQNAN